MTLEVAVENAITELECRLRSVFQRQRDFPREYFSNQFLSAAELLASRFDGSSFLYFRRTIRVIYREVDGVYRQSLGWLNGQDGHEFARLLRERAIEHRICIHQPLAA